MKDFANFYFHYNSVTFRIIRIFIFLFLLTPVVFGLVLRIYPNIFIIPFSLFLMLEVFFTQKVVKLLPQKEVSENTGDFLDSFSLDALSILAANKNSSHFIKELLNLNQVVFMVYKMDTDPNEIQVLDFNREELVKKAFEIAKQVNGRYVTTMDLFAAYLLITEKTSEFLFSKKLKEADLINILLWTSNAYPKEEMAKNREFVFAGEGIAEDWVYGWTLETQKYMTDLTRDFLKIKKEPVLRQNEYQQIVEGLHKNSSVLLVGDTGSGKEAIVGKLAIESYMGYLKGNLYHQRIFELMVDELMAGANTQGELEERLSATLEELSHSGNVIVYIPEFQNILGSKVFNLDISGVLIPYLSLGKVKIIASVNREEFKKSVEPMKSLMDSFAVVEFKEPTRDEVLLMLFDKSFEVEDRYNVFLSYKAVLTAANYGQNYAKDKVMPGSSVALLEDSANSVNLVGKAIVEEQDVLEQIKKVVRVDVGEPKKVEKDLLLNLESELHKKVIGQNYAIVAISEAIRRIRAGINNGEKPISFLFLGPTGVGKTQTAKALADIYFGNSSRLIRFDMSEFVGEDGIKKLIGSTENQEKGLLTEAVFDNPYSLILLDEFEKADQKILDLFLQVFDEGRLTDAKGKTVSFVNSIIIATSNAGSEYIRESVEAGKAENKKFKQTLLEYLQTNSLFKPELLNRFDDIVVFTPLVLSEVEQIVKLMLADFSKTLMEKDVKVSYSQDVIAKIVNEGFDKEFGARPLKRFIQDNLEDLIARKLLSNEINRGSTLILHLNPSGEIEI